MVFAVLCACTGGGAQPRRPAPVDDASAVCGPATPSYAHDIAPILAHDCNGACHGAGGVAWPLTEYDYVSEWATVIQQQVEQGVMPPADAGALPNADRQPLLAWLACGAPRN